MTKLLLIGLIVGSVWAWDARQVADSRFCFELRMDVQVCMLVNSFNNIRNYGQLAQKTKDKQVLAKLKKNINQELKKMCYFWQNMSPASRSFLIENVEYQNIVIGDDGQEYRDDEQLMAEGEMEEVCLSL